MSDKPTVVHLAVIAVTVVALTYGFIRMQRSSSTTPSKNYELGFGPGRYKCICTKDEPVMK